MEEMYRKIKDLQRSTLGDMLGFATSYSSDSLTARRSGTNYSGSFCWEGDLLSKSSAV